MINLEPKYFYLILGIGLILSRIPLLGKYVRVVNTMVHETGHALMALITSGKVLRIELFANTSGTALTKSKSAFSRFLISLAGYPASGLLAWLFFWLMDTGKQEWVLYALAALSILLLILFVRNLYGIFWLITFPAILGVLIFKASDLWIGITALFLTSLIFFESVISTLTLLYLTLSDKKAGDAENLEKQTHIPQMIWAVMFVAFALYICWKIVINYFPAL